MERQEKYIEFIDSFFRFFQARIENFSVIGNKITGVVRWEKENGEQSFSWVIPEKDESIALTKKLIDFLLENNLTCGDKIVIDQEALKKVMKEKGWDLIDVEKAINFLCSVRVDMIDDGDTSDFFLIHF
jgi:hypothetical protein